MNDNKILITMLSAEQTDQVTNDRYNYGDSIVYFITET